jgi:hypothetical protein
MGFPVGGRAAGRAGDGANAGGLRSGSHIPMGAQRAIGPHGGVTRTLAVREVWRP